MLRPFRRALFISSTFALIAAGLGAAATDAGASVSVTVPCTGSGGGGAGLQAAVANANANGGGTITLTAGCTYTLTSAASGGHDAKPSGLVFASSTSLVGNNATIARDSSAPEFGVVEVDSGTVTIANVTITGGRTDGINHAGGVTQFGGTLTLRSADVVANTGLLSNQPNPGGANLVGGSATIKQVTFANNTAANAPTLNIQETTNISLSTFAGNTSSGTTTNASIFVGYAPQVTMSGNLLADTPSAHFTQCQVFGGSMNDGGYNFRSDSSCAGLTAATDGSAGTVSALEDLGGGIQAITPTPYSATLNAIPTSSTLCNGTDPRGVPRPQGNGCEPGATEKAVVAVTGSTSGSTISEGQPWTLTMTATTTATSIGAPTGTFPVWTDGNSTGVTHYLNFTGGSPNTASYTPWPLPQGNDTFLISPVLVSDKWDFTFAATNFAVTVTAPPAVPCTGSGGGVAGLAAAITAANSSGGGGVTLENGCSYALTSVVATEHGPNGLPVIKKQLVIRGNGATLTRDAAAPALRLLDIDYNAKAALYDLTLKGGSTTDTAGAVQANGGSTVFGQGLNIYGNSSSSTYGGGALWNNGTMTLIESTISHNNAAGGPGGAITTTTGGLTLDSDTIADNTAASAPAGVYGYIGGHATIARTLLDNAPGQDCGGTGPTDNGYVYASDASCGLTATTSVQSNDFSNLVQTPYHDGVLYAMPNGGTGKDAVSSVSCLRPNFATSGPLLPDERSLPRPQDGRCDVGAVETGQVAMTVAVDESAVDSGTPAHAHVHLQAPAALPLSGTLTYTDLNGDVHTTDPLSGTDTTLDLALPTGPAGLQEATFTYTGDGTQDNRVGYADVDVRPVLTSITPNRGPASGGVRVKVTGLGLDGVVGATFGSLSATRIKHVSPTELTLTTPRSTAGRVYIQLFGDGFDSASEVTRAARYAFLPTVTSVSPASGPASGGNVVSVTGDGFARASTVSFGRNDATSVTFVSRKELTVTVPAHVPGAVDVVVTSSGLKSKATTADVYTYEAPARSARAV